MSDNNAHEPQAWRRLSILARRNWRHWRPRIGYWSAAASIGIAAAVFARGAESAYRLIEKLYAHWIWLALPASPLALLAVAWITQRYVPSAAGSGIPQVLAALRNEGRSARTQLLSLHVAAGKLLLTLIGLLGGASVGREGPTVQIGAAIAYFMGRRQTPALQRSLILAGGAAGVAAAFNTPIAGIVFAFEELASSLEEHTSGTLLLIVIIAAVVAIALLGDHSYFGVFDINLNLLAAWPAVLLCGVVGGAAGGLFSRTLYAGTHRVRHWFAASDLRRPLLCGAAIAMLAWLAGGATYGSGYAQTRALLESPEALSAWFPLLKGLATLISYLSGIPGGIFSPSLAVGAGLGADLARISDFAPPAATVLLTMAAYFAGATRAPLTAAVIVAEMTLGQRMILPLMGAAMLGAGTARLVWRDSLYRALMRDLMPSLPTPSAHPSPLP